LRPVPFLLAALLACGCTQNDRELVLHDFSTSADGWQVAGDTGPAAPIFQPAGGRSGGYISNVDEATGETWYFQAPPSVLAQLAAAEGGLLEYSLKQSSAAAEAFPDDDVVIVGAAGRLSYRFDYAPGTVWTDFSVPLSVSANWRWNWNARATEAQFRSVLSRASRLEIRGEYVTGDDTGGMDQFVLRGRN
jgi:hypothetical protein